MKVTNEKLAESMKFKDIIREALIKTPMSYSELLTYFNLDKGKLTNHMTQLKKYGFVKYSEAENKLPKDKRKYYVVPDMCSYAQMMSDRRAVNYQMTWKDGMEKFSDNASMKVTTDQYHTKGNTSKINAWAGNSSMGSM
jgi:hypothetical protein